ncbi:MAG: YvcK family protein [Eubacteriales bacterium]|nr:YvcK family protein [Eubacteriales bacterium]MDD4461227.1 YvcK family protein [Eubacteriales bacterium]
MFSVADEKLVDYAKDPDSGPRIVVIGGGTGLSTMLRGLKLYSTNITAIVTVADNGGSSGTLREELGMLPPGDIRNCILALADAEPLLGDLFNYRFSEGRLSGQSFGNLFIAAMNAVSGNFYEAVRNVSKVLAVKGHVLPVSLQNIQIGARLSDGSEIWGESEIGSRPVDEANPIDRVMMMPENAQALPDAIAALASADLIVLGPGSLYTSIIPNLLFPDIIQAIRKSRATRVYVNNIMTQPAETVGYDAARHLQAILYHAGMASARGFIDYCVVNNAWIDQSLIEKYRLESAVPVLCQNLSLERLGVQIIEAPLACVTRGVIRHEPTGLAKIVVRLANAAPENYGRSSHMV